MFKIWGKCLHEHESRLKFLATIMDNVSHQRGCEEIVGCSSSNFFRHYFTVFEGIEGPQAVNNWITSL